MSFSMYEVEYLVGLSKMRGTFVLSLEEIERHVGPFTVLNETELNYVPPNTERGFYKDWKDVWLKVTSLDTNMKVCPRCYGFHVKPYQYSEKSPD